MKSLVAGAVLGCALVMVPAGAAMATPTVPHNPQAPAGIGAGQVIVLRPHRADLIRNHVVVRVVPLPGGPVSLTTVIRAIGDTRWAADTGNSATLFAGLLQRPGTTLTIGGAIHTVRLTDSATSPAYLSGTGATVTFDHVTVTGGAAPESAHRPFIRYDGMTVTVTGTTFRALGSHETGVSIGNGSSFTATDTTFSGSGTGLDLAVPAVLTRVTFTGNAIGLELHAKVSMSGVTLSHNGVGLDAVGLPSGTVIGPLATDHSTIATVVLAGCAGCIVSGLTGNDDTIGVRIDSTSIDAAVRAGTIHATDTGIAVAAARTSIDQVMATVANGATGISIGAAATGTQITGGTITGGATGISIGAPTVSVDGTAIVDATTGVLVGAGATGTTVNRTTTTGATTGLAIDGGAGTVTVAGFTAHQGGGTGIRSGAANVTLINPVIVGAIVGLDLQGGVTVNGGTVRDAAEAVRVGSSGRVRMTGVDLRAHVLGLRVADSASVTLIRSRVSAPLGARGRVHLDAETSFPPLPLRWLGILALIALAFAAFLETLRRLRERSHDRSTTAPSHVLNVA